MLTLVMKFLFSAVSFGSGAPGGIFFPLLILGALIGAVFAMAGVEFFGLASGVCQQFCTAWDDRILYSDCKSTADGDYPVI